MSRFRLPQVLMAVILLSITIYPFPLKPAYTLNQFGDELFYFFIDVEENGSAKITIEITLNGQGTSRIALPKYGYEYAVLKGFVDWGYNIDNESLGPFYEDVFFRYRSHSKVIVTYDFEYASLMIGRNAWFMSPMIRIPPGSKCIVRVKLIGVSKITSTTPGYYAYNSSGIYFDLSGGIPEEGSARVLILYKLSKPVPSKNLTRQLEYGTKLVISTPPIYSKFADYVLEIYSKEYPILAKIFNMTLNRIYVEFYLPESYPSILGYVMAEDIKKDVGGIVHLNLALTRFMKGYLEHTMAHELVHVMLGKIGVSASYNVRWFHEGMAEYLGSYVSLSLGYGNITLMLKDYEEIIKQYKSVNGENFGIVEDWRKASEGNAAYYYAISYYIIKTLGDRYGGVEYYKRVIAVIKKMERIDTTARVVKALSEAAGESLNPMFSKWGFRVPSEEFILPYTRVIAVVILLLVVFTVAIITLSISGEGKKVSVLPRGLYSKCLSCGAILPPTAEKCPYCGHDVEKPFT